MEITQATTLVQLNAPTNFPIKLSATNFPVWRRQIEATLIGFDLLPYIDGSLIVPSQFNDDAKKVPNPCYSTWFRQNQILISAFLGGCTEPVQPLLSAVTTAKEAWDVLLTSYANASPGRILALKSKLSRNPRGNRSIPTYLKDMQEIAGDLALAKNPVSDTDLQIFILNQLGDDYRSIISALRVRNTPTSMLELSEILTDHERLLKDSEDDGPSFLPTANITQSQPSSGSALSDFRKRDHLSGHRSNSGHRPTQSSSGSVSPVPAAGRSRAVCRFCNFSGHVVKDCRKLARFLRDNQIHTPPVVNTMTHSDLSGSSQPWLFDSGASHHAASGVASLQEFSTYDGPDEIRLGNENRHSHHEG
ncbi:unnamed protein product [Cuscuta epithymum]|uniref:CCHC-type domain-containing protein n=1 Tax=Cuscuta epithymum TaxID=186058 RepID=A0AAV0CJV7_9ASTE|nr:unnamed protein product [Cuscuta epithymum]